MEHPYGYIKDGKVFLKGFLGKPDREIGEVKEDEASTLNYFEARFEQIKEKVERLKTDIQENPIAIKNIEEKITRLKQNKIKYELLEEELKASCEPQISTTDADARALLVQGQVVEVSYNIQAAVDSKHNLVVATHTINRNDKNALAAIAIEAKENQKTELIITANGNPDYFNQVEELINNAPELKHWKFTAFIQPTTNIDEIIKGLDEPYVFQEITIKTSEIKFLPLHYDTKIKKLDIIIKF